MDILVHIPHAQEDYVWGTKLQPKRGLTHGYWTLSGKPRFAGQGDRIWFCNLDRAVVASAVIRYIATGVPDDATHAPDATEHELAERDDKPAVCFSIPSVTRHEFDMPRDITHGFRGFRYVSPVASRGRVVGLKSVGAAGAGMRKK
jgi:hypothetical protein